MSRSAFSLFILSRLYACALLPAFLSNQQVKKVKVTKDKRSYFVHYDGWNAKWDEWLKAPRMMKDTPENRQLAKQKQDEAKAAARQKKSGKGKKRKSADTNKKSSSKKNKSGVESFVDDDTVDSESQQLALRELKIKFPGQLKKQLITDWENITREQMLVPLPREPSVSAILDAFLESKQWKGAQLEQTKAVCDGLRQYFNRALGLVLLYRFERPQYEQVVEKKQDVCDVYGAEHLLRLFIKLPSLLVHTALEKQELAVLQGKFSDFLKWLVKHLDTYFAKEYLPTDAKYHAKVEQ